MFLENLIFDASNPQRLGKFWEAVVGGEALTDDTGIYETRMTVDDGPVLDLCFQQVPEPPSEQVRLHLDLHGGGDQAAAVQRLLHLGATPLDIGQGEAPWVVLADPEGNPFCVMEERAEYTETGPIAALPLDCADPQASTEFWSWLTGWPEAAGSAPGTLRHPSGRGPLLELCPEVLPKAASKNRLHLDLRLEPGDDADRIAAEVAQRGGLELEPDWGDLPWRIFTDPSGNEFCILPARSASKRLD